MGGAAINIKKTISNKKIYLKSISSHKISPFLTSKMTPVTTNPRHHVCMISNILKEKYCASIYWNMKNPACSAPIEYPLILF